MQCERCQLGIIVVVLGVGLLLSAHAQPPSSPGVQSPSQNSAVTSLDITITFTAPEEQRRRLHGAPETIDKLREHHNAGKFGAAVARLTGRRPVLSEEEALRLWSRRSLLQDGGVSPPPSTVSGFPAQVQSAVQQALDPTTSLGVQVEFLQALYGPNSAAIGLRVSFPVANAVAVNQQLVVLLANPAAAFSPALLDAAIGRVVSAAVTAAPPPPSPPPAPPPSWMTVPPARNPGLSVSLITLAVALPLGCIVVVAFALMIGVNSLKSRLPKGSTMRRWFTNSMRWRSSFMRRSSRDSREQQGQGEGEEQAVPGNIYAIEESDIEGGDDDDDGADSVDDHASQGGHAGGRRLSMAGSGNSFASSRRQSLGGIIPIGAAIGGSITGGGLRRESSGGYLSAGNNASGQFALASGPNSGGPSTLADTPRRM